MKEHINLDIIHNNTYKWNNRCLGNRTYETVIRSLPLPIGDLVLFVLHSNLGMRKKCVLIDLIKFYVDELICFNKEECITPSFGINIPDVDVEKVVMENIAVTYICAFGTPEEALKRFFLTTAVPNGTPTQQVGIRDIIYNYSQKENK